LVNPLALLPKLKLQLLGHVCIELLDQVSYFLSVVGEGYIIRPGFDISESAIYDTKVPTQLISLYSPFYEMRSSIIPESPMLALCLSRHLAY